MDSSEPKAIRKFVKQLINRTNTRTIATSMLIRERMFGSCESSSATTITSRILFSHGKFWAVILMAESAQRMSGTVRNDVWSVTE